MESKILHAGIDVSKKKLDICLTLNAREYPGEKVVDNNFKGFKVLEKWIGKHAKKHNVAEIRICIESTGIYSEEASEYFLEKNYYVSVVNPAQIKAYRTSLNLRTKTDKVDARAIACYSFMTNPIRTAKSPKELRDYRILVRHLEYLIRRRGEEKGRMETARSRMVEDSTNKTIQFYDQQIEDLRNTIEKHLEDYPELRNNLNLLESIPGIGEHTANILLCELHPEDGGMRISKKAQTAHAGLAPSERQSGTNIYGRARLCKTGNPRLRKSLYFPAMTATKHNPFVSALYQRLLEKGKPKKLALTACMRKLLVIAIGILNNQIPFDPDWEKKRKLFNKKTFDF